MCGVIVSEPGAVATGSYGPIKGNRTPKVLSNCSPGQRPGLAIVRQSTNSERVHKRPFKTTADGVEVQHLDVLNYTNKVFRHLYSKAYIDLVNKMPEVPGWMYDKLDKPWKNERRRLALDKLNTRPFVKVLREYQPDMIVCTHFLPAEIVSWLKAKERLASRQAKLGRALGPRFPAWASRVGPIQEGTRVKRHKGGLHLLL